LWLFVCFALRLQSRDSFWGGVKVVAAAARTIKIILEVNPPASAHVFRQEDGGNVAATAADQPNTKVPADKVAPGVKIPAGQVLSAEASIPKSPL
jgi:hypothetical protein